MPRVTFVKKARKDNPVCKKGQSYYWWKFRYGGKRYSLTPPKQSQLTQSAYFGTLYSIQEEVEGYTLEEHSDWEGMLDDIKGQLEELQSETQDSLDNMPEQLQYAPTGELLQERIDALDSAISDIDCLDEPEEPDDEDYEREDFDDSEFEEEDDRNDAEREHEAEQDQLETEFYNEQTAENDAKFESFKEEGKSSVCEAIDQAIV